MTDHFLQWPGSGNTPSAAVSDSRSVWRGWNVWHFTGEEMDECSHSLNYWESPGFTPPKEEAGSPTNFSPPVFFTLFPRTFWSRYAYWIFGTFRIEKAVDIKVLHLWPRIPDIFRTSKYIFLYINTICLFTDFTFFHWHHYELGLVPSHLFVMRVNVEDRMVPWRRGSLHHNINHRFVWYVVTCG